MNCARIREQLVETARGRELPSDLRARVFDHAARCAECDRLLDNQSQLTVALAELALYTDGAPARIEHMIRRQLPVPIRRPVSGKWLWAGVAAAAGLMLAAVTLSHPGSAPGSKPPMPVRAALQAPKPVVRESPAVSPAAVKHAAAANPAASGDWNTDDFVPLPYAEELSPDEQTDMVRVSLPRESLLALGVPVRADRFGEQVLADVLIGTDGTARAIRISD